MKKSIFKTLAAGIIASILVTSCSVEKRHYTSGYSVQWNSKKTTVSATEASYVAKQTPKTETKTVLENKITSQAPLEQVTVTNHTNNKTLVASASKAVHTPVIKTKVNSFENAVANNNTKIVDKIAAANIVKAPVKGEGDTNLIIEIILCFFPFFNLIAMYLKDGKSITLNFWIDLILDLLFFLPGIIFALLVVLDVVNLA